MLQLLAECRHVAQRALQGDQRLAQLQQFVQFGYLSSDLVRPEVMDGLELQADRQLGVGGGAEQGGH
ncbi:hypothetical protein D3C80_1956930 [compost metagenome]